MLSKRHVVAAAALVVAAVSVPAPASAMDIGVGFGGYALTDRDPAMATVINFHATDFKFGGTFALRTGESVTNVLLGAKAQAVVKTVGTTEIGVGGSFSFESNASAGTDSVIGLGIGGGVEKRLGDGFAVMADIWPLSFRFNGGTRVGILSSGSLGVTWYFSES